MAIVRLPLMLVCLGVLTLASAARPLAGPAQPSFLGTVEFEATDLEILEQWRELLDRVEAERNGYLQCEARLAECGPATLLAWRALIGRLRGKPLRQQLEEVNQFVNVRDEISDIEAYGVDDHWATPLEFLETSGDSEDFAIMKYVSLREAGVPAEERRARGITDGLVRVSVGLEGIDYLRKGFERGFAKVAGSKSKAS